MNSSNQALTTVTIWESYVGNKAPSNAAGSRRGYGLTRADALADASHWNNQAPFAKARRVTLCDQAKPLSLTTDEELIAWAICGEPGEFVPATSAENCRARLIRQGKYATAVRDFFGVVHPKGSQEVVSIEIMCHALAQLGAA